MSWICHTSYKIASRKNIDRFLLFFLHLLRRLPVFWALVLNLAPAEHQGPDTLYLLANFSAVNSMGLEPSGPGTENSDLQWLPVTSQWYGQVWPGMARLGEVWPWSFFHAIQHKHWSKEKILPIHNINTGSFIHSAGKRIHHIVIGQFQEKEEGRNTHRCLTAFHFGATFLIWSDILTVVDHVNHVDIKID